MALVTRRLPMSEEGRKQQERIRNHQSYMKSEENMATLRAQLPEFVQSGKISQKETDAVLLSRLKGHYRVQPEMEICAREIEETKR